MWKSINEASNYEISDKGEVRNKVTKYILKGRLNKSGYLQVSIKIDKDNAFHNRYIHRLVAEYFLPQVEENLIINHKDGNKQNNKVENLEQVTQSKNIQHAHDHHLIKRTSNRRVGMFDKDGQLIQEFNSIVEAYKTLNKPSRVNIDNAIQGKQKTAYGYIQKYLD